MLAYGIDPKVIMAELTGRAAGISKGKGGSMHMFSVEHGFYGGHGIVGAQVPSAPASPSSTNIPSDGGVCLAYFGDGAANQGQVYESFNMAELWKLPIIFVIENNQYAMGTSVNRSSAGGAALQARRELPHPGHPGRRDGRARGARRGRRRARMGALRQGADHARAQDLPLSRPFDVRPGQIPLARGGAGGARASDPIEHAAKELEAMGVEEDELKAIDKQIKEIVVEAAELRRGGARARSGRALHRRAGGELLMPIELKMPALSPTMEEGTLAKWLVKEGDDVKSGDILAEIETDKATMEFEAVDEGTIAKILVPEGTDGVKVGQPIALIAGEGEEVSRSRGRAAELRRRAGRRPASTDAARSREAEPAPTAGRGDADAASVRDRGARPGRRRRPDARRARSARRHPMVRTTVREALRDAMAEEMRKDERVFVMGEEVAEYQGAYKVTQGLLDEFGPKRVIDTPITEYGFAGVGTGAAMGGLQADRRVHDLQLRDAGDRPHHQFGRQDQLHVGRPDALPDRVPRPQRRRGARRRAAQPELRPLVRAACPA